MTETRFVCRFFRNHSNMMFPCFISYFCDWVIRAYALQITRPFFLFSNYNANSSNLTISNKSVLNIISDSYVHFTPTQLDLSLPQNAFDQGKHIYATHDYIHAIELYTKALSSIHQDLKYLILLHRAFAYEKVSTMPKSDRRLHTYRLEHIDQKQRLLRPDIYYMRASILL
ncbi:hypothetical protein BDA99DRAFT_568349 [Phascolomyces articulosus]|uniref:Uncharacterized protein n=1 Tax=Phascolomyces articulosus TaxID=60185 RepID=A0AAD5K9K9_9FUNG|nr:hypothetical protein BDA99DRAFT_568349 [Phascolomyces articulosus]